MKSLGLIVLFLAALQTPPSGSEFSGSWSLDPARSVLHPSAPRAVELDLVDRNAQVAVEFRHGRAVDKYACTTDGKPCEQDVGGGDVYVRSLRRQDGALLWRVKMTRGSDHASIEYTERWSISDKGQTLTIYQLFPGPREFIRVFARKSPGRERAK
jgi:hypothetical protein